MEYNNMGTEDTDLCTLLCLVILVIILSANLPDMNEDLVENNAEVDVRWNGGFGIYNRETGEYDAWLSWKWGFWDE